MALVFLVEAVRPLKSGWLLPALVHLFQLVVVWGLAAPPYVLQRVQSMPVSLGGLSAFFGIGATIPVPLLVDLWRLSLGVQASLVGLT